MAQSIRKALRDAALILLMLAGGLFVGSLTPAYSQDPAPASSNAPATSP